VQLEAGALPVGVAGPSLPAARRAWRRTRILLGSGGARLGTAILILVALCAIAPGWLAPADPNEQNLLARFTRPASRSADGTLAVLGTDQELIDEIITAGREVGEKFWQLPLDKEYSKQIKSDIADIKNVGGRKAGTITAAAFLKEFADGLSWAHLDIAGTAWGDDAKPYRSKGPTGIAVRTLLRIVERASQR